MIPRSNRPMTRGLWLHKKTRALIYQARQHRGPGYSPKVRQGIARAIKTQRKKLGPVAHREAYNKGHYV